MSTEELGWYASIFCWLYFTGIGVPPCPEEAGILYAASLHALHPQVVRWPLAWLMTGLGIVCADMTLYGVGRRWGPRLFQYRWVERVMSTERRQRIERKFQKHGTKLLLLARFLPPLRTGIFLLAGAARFSFLLFLLSDCVYAVFGVGLFFWGGTWLVDMIRQTGHLAVYLVAVPAIGYGLFEYYRYLKRRELRPEVEPPVSVLEVPAASVSAATPRARSGR